MNTAKLFVFTSFLIPLLSVSVTAQVNVQIDGGKTVFSGEINGENMQDVEVIEGVVYCVTDGDSEKIETCESYQNQNPSGNVIIVESRSDIPEDDGDFHFFWEN
jgi:hypothetical protein